ncbi:MAG: DUF2339 domain-containing protein [Pseudonocardia sp.]
MDPRPDPTDPLVALASEVGALGRRLDRIGAELLSLRAGTLDPRSPAPSAGSRPAPAGVGSGGAAGPQGGPWVAPQPPAGPAWAHAPAGLPAGPGWEQVPAGLPAGPGWEQVPASPPAGPGWAQGPASPPPPGGPADAPVPGWPAPRRRPRVSVATLLPWTGAAVTLVGVVSLIVLAVQRGWFSPEARIVAGGVLGVVLVALGMRLHRNEVARTGALALAATGFATLYLVIAGATFVVGLPEVPAVVLALVVAGAGLGLADRWRSQLLAGGVVVGAVVLAPVLVEGPLLVALVLVLQVAAVPVVLRRTWPVLVLLAAAGPVLYGAVVALDDAAQRPLVAALTASAVLLAGLVTAALGARRLPPGPVAALVAATPLPVVAAAPELAGWSGWAGPALAAAAAVALLVVAVLPRMPQVVRTVALTAAAVALFQATALTFDGATRTAVFLGQATVLAVAAAALRRRLPLVVAAAYGLVGVIAALVVDAPLAALVEPRWPYVVDGQPVVAALVGGLVVSVLVLAAAVAAVVAAGRLGLVRPDSTTAWLWVPAGLVGLYGAAGVVITAALLVTRDVVGFTAGHAVVTVSWTVAALVLLARGISRQALRITGLALVAASVAKLVLFDLAALDGIAQVVAFLGAGLLILAAGTRYARLVAEAEHAAAAAGGDPEGAADPA